MITFIEAPVEEKISSLVTNADRALGLDLGLELGYAVAERDKETGQWNINKDHVGVLNLRLRKNEVYATAFIKFWDFLEKIKPGRIFYEELYYTPRKKESTWGRFVSRDILVSLRTILQLWASHNMISVEGVNPSKITAFLRKEVNEFKNPRESNLTKKMAAVTFVKKRFGIEVKHHTADAILCLLLGLAYNGTARFAEAIKQLEAGKGK